MDPRETSKILQRIYLRQLVSAVLLVAIASLLRYYLHWTNAENNVSQTVMVIVTTLSGVTGIAIPIFYRSYFVYRIRDKKQISPDSFLNFERTLLTVALFTPNFLVVAILMNMNQTALMLIALFSIYAAYYYFPSGKKVLFEMKLFRIKPINRQEE